MAEGGQIEAELKAGRSEEQTRDGVERRNSIYEMICKKQRIASALKALSQGELIDQINNKISPKSGMPNGQKKRGRCCLSAPRVPAVMNPAFCSHPWNHAIPQDL